MRRARLQVFVIAGVTLLTLGCQTPPYCEPLGACGGELLVPGAPLTQWVTTKPNACLEQIQPSPNPVSLVQQPQKPAGDRPTERGTADWCSGVALRQDGTLQQFLRWNPPLPVQDATLDLKPDGHYEMHITNDANQHVEFPASCLSAQGISESCPAFGRNLKELLAQEPNIYNPRCYPSEVSGCSCDYDLSLIGGPSGQWSADPRTATLTFFDALDNPPSLATYCQKGDSLELTGKDGSRLFNQFGLRTIKFRRPTCHDGVQSKSIGELGVDCGGSCNPELPADMGPPGCPDTCTDGIQDGREQGVDCGGTCPMCECHNGAQDAWEEGVDCGGPCKDVCACFDGALSPGEDGVDCGGVCSKKCP
ncbi:MAG TPA: hypothetical protein VNG33_10165 [Polyangiaceae bacterium]|nr:hypothetical protein [Polyangiaceae bacterium]